MALIASALAYADKTKSGFRCRVKTQAAIPRWAIAGRMNSTINRL